MHSTPHHPRHRWDGSRTNARPHRSLRLAPEPGTPLLRAGQTGRCRDCGNLIEWYHRPDHRPVPLHPKELPADFVPETNRWSVSAGIAYPAGDGTAWCRVPHAALCPAHPSEPVTEQLAALRRTMATYTRRLIDTGRFTPQRPAPARHHPNRPARPVVQILGIRYLAAHQVEDIHCLARSTSTRARCTQPLADPTCTPGTWRLLPVTVSTSRQLALPGQADMLVYDLMGLPYTEQVRWRSQRCRHHTATRAEMATSDWEPFDPLVHHEHIRTDLPDPAPRSSRATSRCHYT
ncbi:DUF6083 domain-containing protein [Actinacidiphila acidipaludis]|uniref:C2H2-type domain-containing protein n=1 Tax=Actinacidiphila acidipaludis TaxID=2873382 RepID=A0ABS7QEL4_9ACTN|nr:DUF6083 domain-containing protein [Streptomyces acidipaludis]MBY8881577.1 hypothetical protein [Streptomyces acidipaludis]